MTTPEAQDMTRPWVILVRDDGQRVTFADEHRARQRARELIEGPIAEVLVCKIDSEQIPTPDPEASSKMSPSPGPYPDPDPHPYGERWVYRHGVDPVREVRMGGAWRPIENEPRFSEAAVRADNNHLLVPVNTLFEGWAYAWRGTCLTCGVQCYRRAESPGQQVWRHGFPAD